MKHVAWVGVVAVIAALGFGGYAAADSTNLVVKGSTELAGPLIFYGGGYFGSGGPVGEGLVTEGHRCSMTRLVTNAVDGGVVGHDYNQVEAFVTLQGLNPRTYVIGTQLHTRPQDDYVNGLRVCLNKAAPLHGIRFNYFIANVSWDF
jgi:hypothetical protein